MPITITSKPMVLTAGPGRHHVDKCLYLAVSEDGRSRRYIFRFTSPVTGRANEKSLGSAVDVELAKAKQQASKLRALIAEGRDPVLVAKQERDREQRESMTLTKVIDKYAKDFASRSDQPPETGPGRMLVDSWAVA
jgi:hypothetical protein